jgi:dihydrofolate reductase
MTHKENKMRKVILFMHVSLDGFIAGPNGELDWTVTDDEMNDDLLPDLPRTVDTALLGRVAYQDLANYWPSAATNPSSSKGEIAFAHWIDKAPKIVFSKTLEKVEWQNSRIVKGNIAEEIATLKQQEGQDLVLFGGVGIAQTFMQHGFIDEYRLVVHPVLLGSGKSLFQDIKNRIHLKLVNTKAFRSGAILLHYQSDKK